MRMNEFVRKTSITPNTVSVSLVTTHKALTLFIIMIAFVTGLYYTEGLE